MIQRACCGLTDEQGDNRNLHGGSRRLALIKLGLAISALFAVAFMLLSTPTQSLANEPDSSSQDLKFMYRLYNPYSGEHFYTSDDAEYENVVAAGWTYEGIGWTAPETSGTAVYRVYNPYAGEHHYTMDAAERDSLVSGGWVDEGIGWYSDDAQAEPLYRQYNPNEYANNHNYTKDADERDHLISIGWQDEGVGWYGCSSENYAMKPEAIDPDHENVIDYADDAVVVQGASYSIAADGSVSIAPDDLPGGLNPGDVIVLEPTSENPSGIAVKVDAGGAYDGDLTGGTPDISEVYDLIDVETIGVVLSDGFVPEPDVEVVNVAEVALDQTAPAETTVIYPQSVQSGANAVQSEVGQEGVLRAASLPDLTGKDETDGLKVMAADAGGSSTSKLTLKFKGLTFTIKPTGTLKCNYDLNGINNLYVSVKFEESLSVAEKLSSLIGEEPISKKLGSVTFATSVPGLYLEGSIWFTLDADGKVKLSFAASQELGVKYTKAKGCIPVNEYSCKPKLSFSANLETGIDFVGVVKIVTLKVVDPSLEARFTLGVDTADAITRSNGMMCNDAKLKFAPSFSIGSHEGLFKEMGIKFKKKLAQVTLKTWHMENGKFVRSCTWDESSDAYESSPLLFENENAVYDEVYRDIYGSYGPVFDDVYAGVSGSSSL